MSKSYHHGDLRTAILDAAEKILVESSLNAVSMRELARKAGVSPGAPYHHFGDRLGLVNGLCQRGFSKLYEILSRAQARNGIKGMISEYIKFARKKQSLYQLMFSVEATEGKNKEMLAPFASPVFFLLEEEIKKIGNSMGRPQENSTPISVWCFMHGLASLSVASPLQAKMGQKKIETFALETIGKLIDSQTS